MDHLLNTQHKSLTCLRLALAGSSRGLMAIPRWSLVVCQVIGLGLVILLPQAVVRSAAAAEPSTLVADLSLPAVTNIQQLRLLSREEARRGYPVKVTATVTYFDPAWN